MCPRLNKWLRKQKKRADRKARRALPPKQE